MKYDVLVRLTVDAGTDSPRLAALAVDKAIELLGLDAATVDVRPHEDDDADAAWDAADRHVMQRGAAPQS